VGSKNHAEKLRFHLTPVQSHTPPSHRTADIGNVDSTHALLCTGHCPSYQAIFYHM